MVNGRVCVGVCNDSFVLVRACGRTMQLGFEGCHQDRIEW